MIGEEQKLVAFNRKKLLANWRNIMRIAKTEELRNEIEVYSQNNARELDSKEAYLQMLDKNLDEADEQYQMALRNHLIHLDELIALQDSRLTAMQNEFDRDTRIIVDEFERVIKSSCD
jgi:dynein regulatory complex subunit 2